MTCEIACQRPNADVDNFDWRVSIAHIASNGEFSVFAGVDRVITLLDGAGARLHDTGGTFDHPLDTPLAPFAFAGEAQVRCTLLEGDCQDFNVMTRRAVCRAEVAVWRETTTLPATSAGLLFAVRGGCRAGTHTLHPGQGLWWSNESLSWSLSFEGTNPALLSVSIYPAHP